MKYTKVVKSRGLKGKGKIPHECNICRKEIPIGTECVIAVDSGYWSTWKDKGYALNIRAHKECWTTKLNNLFLKRPQDFDRALKKAMAEGQRWMWEGTKR